MVNYTDNWRYIVN